ncbi:MAG: Maf family protein [Alphaproteobacteria bacterium]|nr:Maf family protein [Alphaproteobacteria bacterium]
MIILASGSPRRQELLKNLGLAFKIVNPNIDEIIPKSTPIPKIPLAIALQKAKAVLPQFTPNDIIIAADTIVNYKNEIIGKPKNKQDAELILQKLSGKTHQVYTGVVILYQNKIKKISCVTKVNFNTLSVNEINFYIKKYKPFDKAGAYAIQEWIGLIGINKIEGDFYNVMGLPVSKLYTYLKKIKSI